MTVYHHPIPGVAAGSPFGMRRHPIHGDMRMHNGIDFGAPAGTPVLAVTAGRVTVKPNNGGAGNTVELTDGNGDVYKYFHLSAFDVVSGQTVTAGQTVGKVGTTGSSTGPHLHFEWHPNGGAAVDPAPILTGADVTAPTGGPAVPGIQTATAGLPGLPVDPTLLADPHTWLRVVMVLGGGGLVALGAVVIVRETKLGRMATSAAADAAKVAALGPAGAAL